MLSSLSLCVFIYWRYVLQKFLHVHNKPGFKSFYEEMLSRQEEQQQQQKLIKKQKEDKQVILLLWRRLAFQVMCLVRTEAVKGKRRKFYYTSHQL
jgi:hypothetical protein